MIERHLDDLVFGQHALDLALEVRPFPRAPKVVDHQEPARQQVAAEPLRFWFRHVHVADFERIQERKLAQLWVVKSNRVFAFVGVQVDQTVDDGEELLVGFRVVRGPRSTVASASATTVDSPCEEELATAGVRVHERRPEILPPNRSLRLGGACLDARGHLGPLGRPRRCAREQHERRGRGSQCPGVPPERIEHTSRQAPQRDHGPTLLGRATPRTPRSRNSLPPTIATPNRSASI